MIEHSELSKVIDKHLVKDYNTWLDRLKKYYEWVNVIICSHDYGIAEKRDKYYILDCTKCGQVLKCILVGNKDVVVVDEHIKTKGDK